VGDTMIGHVFKIVKCVTILTAKQYQMQGLVKCFLENIYNLKSNVLMFFCIDTKCKWIKQLIFWSEFGFTTIG
jgi:hypothetical protein